MSFAMAEYFLRPDQAIYGRAYMQEEVERAGDSWSMVDYKQNGGYIFGEWFSVACPNGEAGSNHASRCVQISEEMFNSAKANAWQSDNEPEIIVYLL